MKRAVFFLLLLALEAASFSQNLIVNPGFETWSKITRPSGWTTAQSCQKDSVYYMSGNYSCQHTGITGETKCLGQTLNISPGKQYKFSFSYKTEITGSGNGCRIWCNWKDSARVDIIDPSTKPVLQPSQFMRSSTWQHFSVDIIAPSDASYFILEVRTYQNSIAFFDDFAFEENVATSIPEENLSDILVYPNPAQDYLIISKIQNLQHIDIHSISGMIIWSSNFSGEETVTIPVTGLSNGLYIICIQTSDKIITRKFIRKAN